jgi:uridine phosphorylase
MSQEALPITALPVASLPPAVIVCGDPSRAMFIAQLLNGPELLSDHREYRAYRGGYRGSPVAVCSHGIGAPGAAIAFEELIAAGARAIIRVGTCGALQEDMAAGDLVIATAAVQHTGYGREVVPRGFPAVAHPDLVQALRRAARAQDQATRTGIVLTRDAFYQGVALPSAPDYQQLSALGVLAVEMECAALFLVASLRGVRAAAILAVDGNVLRSGGEEMDTYEPGQAVVQQAVAAETRIALEALVGRGDEHGE